MGEFAAFVLLAIIIYVAILLRNAKLNKEDRDYIEENKALLETVTKANRGERSERNIVLTLLKHGIQAQDIFHDLYIEKPNGRFAQVDLAVVTDAGVIVIEVKDYSGWIFGNGYQEKWTQILAYGRQRCRFYNPIKQNNGHITALKGFLKESVPFYSIVAFNGKCELREITNIPHNTFVIYYSNIAKTIDDIINRNTPINYRNKPFILLQFRQGVENGNNADIRARHTENVEHIKNIRNPR